MAKQLVPAFPSGGCSGKVAWKLVGAEWFPINPPPANANCTAASIFEFQGETIQTDVNHGLPHEAFKALRKAFGKDIKEVNPNNIDQLKPGSGVFTLPMVRKGTKVKIP